MIDNPPENEIFKILADSISDSFFALDRDLRYTYWNKASEKLTGIPASKAISKHLFDIFPEVKGTNVEIIYRKVLESGKQENFINTYELNGKKHIFGIDVYPSAQGITVLARNLTSYFDSEDFQKEVNRRFRSTFDNVLEGVAIFDHNWNYLYLNEAHARHANLDLEISTGGYLFDLVPGFENSDFFKSYKRTMEERIPQQIEDCFTFQDGSTRWYEARSVPVPEGIFLLTIEITERKHYEQELLKYQSILNQASKMAHVGSWWIDISNKKDLNANPLYWSEEVYNIFGLDKEKTTVTNELFFNAVHPDDREKVAGEVAKSLAEKNAYNVEHRIIRPDGTERIVVEHAELRVDRDGNPECLVGAVHDITKFRRTLNQRDDLVIELGKETNILRAIIESVPDEIWVFDKKAELMFANPAVKKGLGFKELKDLSLDKVLTALEIRHLDGTLRNPEESAVFRSLKGEEFSGDEMVRHLETGEYRYRHFHSAPMRDKDGEIFGAVIIVTDVTEQKIIEEKIRDLLKTSQRRTAELNAIIESIPDAVFIGTAQGMTQVNRNGLELLGADSLADLQSRIGYLGEKFNVRRLDTGMLLKEEELQFYRALQGETVVEEVMATNVKTGKDIVLRVASAPIKDNGEVIGAVAVDSDITDMKNIEMSIKASLKEKEVLLRELYHRTKNNMQVISSLLGLKAADIKDDKITVILEDMKNRIQAIALVHQKLYQSQNLSRVNIRDYVSDLINLLKSSHLIENGRIKFDLDLDDISVLIDTAVPCGLIINELISNSLKYAFPDGRKGNINISFKRIDGDLIELRISDNGVGMNGDMTEENYNLGLRLFNIIAEDQLQAETSLETSSGVSWSVKFRDILYDERI
jgi:PAS domain S-box-containing protein